MPGPIRGRRSPPPGESGSTTDTTAPASADTPASNAWGPTPSSSPRWKSPAARNRPALSTADSLFNPAGVGNVSGQAKVLGNLPMLNDGSQRPGADRGGLIDDPNSVMTQASDASGAADIRRIVTMREGAPKTAELVAQKLAELYGPFTAANTPENRAAILANLTWIADTSKGIAYDDSRASLSDPTTQSPNETLSSRSGVCRDIHTTTSAVLASLVNARQVNGKWVPGSPDGQEANVQTIEFNNPTEHHAFMVYRDPVTGGWNALEYGKHYKLDAPNAVDAFRSLPGYISGYTRYTLNGWDGKPFVNSRGAVGANRSNAFFKEDAGVGEKGEVRFQVGSNQLGTTAFLTERLSLSAAVDPSELKNGLRGGIKVNYHDDFETVDRKGYLRVAGGVTADFFEASQRIGQRGKAERGQYQTYVLGLKVDGRLEGKERELLRQHLKASYGVDLDTLVGLPVSTGDGIQGFVVPVGALSDYALNNLGADARLSGQERLSDNLTLDWAVRLRYQADLINAGKELRTSGRSTAARSLLKDPPRAEFGMALTHRAPGGLVTRFEAGGTQLLARPYDPKTSPQELHQAVLTVSPESGLLNFGLVAKGETIDQKFIPVNGLGVALDYNPSRHVSVGAGVQSVFPDGNVRDIGQNVQVTGNVSVRF
ncbi:MAG: transglutaminase-like domain-containing protein [Myxococcota bacterium]